MTAGAIAAPDARAALTSLLGHRNADDALDGYGADAEVRAMERAYRREIAEAVATAYGAPATSQRSIDAAAARLEGVLATAKGRALITRAQDHSEVRRSDLLRELATDASLDAARVAQSTQSSFWEAVTSWDTWQAVGEFALSFTPAGVVLDTRDFFKALRDGDRGALALAAVGFLPGALGELGKGAVKAVLKELGDWDGVLKARPKAQDPRLQKIYSELYQDSDRLPGGTSGALLLEATEPGKWRDREGELQPQHLIKANERIVQIERVLVDQKNTISPQDREIAKRVQDDLRAAVAIARAAIKDHKQ